MNNDEIENPRPERVEAPFRIFVDQVGYTPHDEKYAVFTFPAGFFTVVNESGATVLSGVPIPAGRDEASGETLWRGDMTALCRPGRYRVCCGKESSMPFSVGEDVYRQCFDSCMKSFYYQRCGCGLEGKYAGAWNHGKCHTGKAVLWENPNISLEVSGGWHDAGDYGRYVTPAAAALAHLLYAWKMYPDAFLEQDICIPGKPSEMPDVLIECKYELQWLLKMQRFDGAVWHKATTAKHAGFVMPEQDKGQVFVMPVSSNATADFAAITALASTVYREYDEKFADWLLKCSLAAYDWLEKNPNPLGFVNPEGCDTGVYAELSDRDNRYWAAAELFAALGDDKYYTRATELMDERFPLTDLSFVSVGGFGSLALLLNRKGSAAVLNRLHREFTDHAVRLAGICDKNGWGVSLQPDQYLWGSNMLVLTNGMIFLIADYLEKNSVSGNAMFRKYAKKQIDYILGVNATGYSFITGCGEFCANYPHHRPAHADNIEECIPGLVCGGPNSHLDDKYAAALIPKGTPPMKCYSDNMECFSLNETAIYWDSPAVFLLAGLQK